MLYPNSIKKKYNKQIDYGNRGMKLESLINDTNEYYFDNNIALIFKKPTPIGIAKTSYSETGIKIDKAFFKEKSTLDYNGVYKGRYIEFDAKETMNKTSFPISNIHEHQINHIKKVIEHNGICFLIIKMNNLYYLLLGKDLISFLSTTNRKSIPYEYIKEKGYEIFEKYNPALDYIKILNYIYFKEEI